jgi:hypothetical protein
MDIENVIGKHVALDPLREGFRGCCPFHADSKRMLIVIPSIDYYECLVCGKQGNTDDFIIEMKRSKQVQEALCNVNRRGTVYVLELEGGRYYIGFTKRLRRGFESTVPQRKVLFGIIPNNMPVTFVMDVCIRYRRSNLYIAAKRLRGLEWCFIFLFNVYRN